MKERPILFSAPMVRAILNGSKTQTRRVLKPQPDWLQEVSHCNYIGPFAYPIGYLGQQCGCPLFIDGRKDRHYGIRNHYGDLGDRLWVKETWTGTHYLEGNDVHLVYSADGAERCIASPDGYVLPKAAAKVGKWVTPLFMPRWASRITLEITDLRVQRLQEISEEDALAEGCSPHLVTEQDIADMQISDSAPHIKELARILGPGQFTAKHQFSNLWDKINASKFPWKSNLWVWAISFKRV